MTFSSVFCRKELHFGLVIALLGAGSILICAEIAFAHSHYLEMDLEQLMAIPVYAASKHQQTIREAPPQLPSSGRKRYSVSAIGILGNCCVLCRDFMSLKTGAPPVL